LGHAGRIENWHFADIPCQTRQIFEIQINKQTRSKEL